MSHGLAMFVERARSVPGRPGIAVSGPVIGAMPERGEPLRYQSGHHEDVFTLAGYVAPPRGAEQPHVEIVLREEGLLFALEGGLLVEASVAHRVFSASIEPNEPAYCGPCFIELADGRTRGLARLQGGVALIVALDRSALGLRSPTVTALRLGERLIDADRIQDLHPGWPARLVARYRRGSGTDVAVVRGAGGGRPGSDVVVRCAGGVLLDASVLAVGPRDLTQLEIEQSLPDGVTTVSLTPKLPAFPQRTESAA